ncbi:MAG: hypothetical protein N3A01_09875 [Bacteroidales bacterium]|nr:hypothetical protein [Bacteroidales bacterium]
MKRIFIYFITFLLANCSGEFKNTQPPYVVIFIDFSKSVKNDLTFYKTNLFKIIDKLPQGSKVIVGKIKETTMATFVPMVNVTLPTFNFITDSELDVQEEMERQKEMIKKEIELSIDSAKLADQTNIVSAFILAKELFKNSSNSYLFIFSDMMHSYEDFDLEKTNISDEFITKKINELNKQNKIPDLSNVKVYLIGAKSESERKYFKIKKFWEEYLKVTKCELIHYGYSLIDVEF